MRAAGARPGRRRAGRAAFAALALLAGCAPAAAPVPPAPEPRLPALPPLTGTEIAAVAALLRMEDRRALEPQHHARLIAHAHPVVRGRAALAAGRVGGVDAALLLVPLLDDESSAVRGDAAFALGLLGDTASTVIDALVRLAGDSVVDSAVLEAVAALGRIGGEAAAEAILALLQRDPVPLPGGRDAGSAVTAADAERAGEAALAAWRLPRSDALTDALAERTADPRRELRWRATYSLMRLAPPRAGAALRARLDDDDPFIRSLAARALRAPLVDSARLTDARAALVQRLDDADAHVRINALRALGSHTGHGIAASVARRLADPDSTVIFAAAEALAALGAEAVPYLRGVAHDSAARPALRAVAVAALGAHAWPQAAPLLAAWQSSADWRLRLYAARALAGAEWADAGGMAVAFARDADARVAAAGFTALGAMLPPGTGRAILTEGLSSGDPFVRAAALRALRRQIQPADLGMLLEAYAAAAADREPDAAIAAIDALAELAGRNVPVHRAFYARFAAPADAVVRRHASERIAPSPWSAAPIETGRATEFYEEVVRDWIAAPLEGAPPPRAVIEGPRGRIVLELDGASAPLTVHNFASLAEIGFFDGTGGTPLRWHRVVANFVLQDGDPRGDGAGGPGYAIRDELNRVRYGRGALGMALSGPDTGGSQWFITHSPQPHLDGAYTVFGRVTEGMHVADAILQDDPIHAIRIEREPAVRGSGPP
jgi:cyclophilin family peptidyl-prolyl cis-trans isomerase/HEAT repeat protein